MLQILMLKVVQSSIFSAWLSSLRDTNATARILTRIARVRDGNLGDHKSIGNGVFELRLSFGPGYRIYMVKSGSDVVILLAGGDKSSQQRDIELAKKIWDRWPQKS